MRETNVLAPPQNPDDKVKFSFKSSVSPAERDKLAMFGRWISVAEPARDKFADKRKWNEGRDFYLGKHYRREENRRYPYRERAVVNDIARVVETIIPLLTDSRPQMQAQARVPENEPFARGCDAQLAWIWENNNMDMKSVEALKVALTCGTAFFKVHFDPFLSGGIGEVAIDVIDPEQLLFSPDCPTSDIDDSRYVIYSVARDIYQLSTRYGLDFGKYENDTKIASDLQFDGSATGLGAVVTDTSNVKHTIWDIVAGVTGNRSAPDGAYLVHEIWWRNADYPDGRVAIVINNRIVKEMANPNPGGWFPFVKLVDKEVPGEIYGKSTVQDLLPLQRERNHWRSMIQAHNNKVANPIKIVPRTANLTKPEIESNVPGIVWQPATVEDANQIKYLEPPQLGQEILQLAAQAPSDIDAISGIRDAIQGQRPEAVVSGRAVANLQEAQMVRIRLQQRNFENAVSRIGQRALDLALHYYTEKRMIRTMDSQGANEFHTIIPKMEVDIEGNPVGKYFETFKHSGYDENGNPIQTTPVKSTLDPQVDVRVITGSSLPISKSQRFQQLMDLFQAGLVLPKHVRESIDWLDNARIEKDMADEEAKKGPPPPLQRDQNSYNFNMPMDKVLAAIQMVNPGLAQQLSKSIAEAFITKHDDAAQGSPQGPPGAIPPAQGQGG